jgi:diheme cytochrome c
MRIINSLLASAIAFGAILALAACQQRPLPEADSPQAQVYVQRCGQCHSAYDPRSMTSAMWDTQVTLMEGKIREAGLPPLSDDQRKTIMDYLTRNAGAQ